MTKKKKVEITIKVIENSDWMKPDSGLFGDSYGLSGAGDGCSRRGKRGKHGAQMEKAGGLYKRDARVRLECGGWGSVCGRKGK